jgi:hypothetical protein
MKTIFNALSKSPRLCFVTVFRHADGQIDYIKHSTREWRATCEPWVPPHKEPPKPLYRINVYPRS